jgi:diacylglycerol kinase family enzyme
VGLDAEVVHLVERARISGSRANPTLYVRAAIRHFFAESDRRHPALTLRRPGMPPVPGLFLGIVSNTTPWTYLGRRPVIPSPGADFDAGLDFFGSRRMDALTTLFMLGQMLVPVAGGGVRSRAAVHAHDVAEFTLTASRPIAFQVDGDYLGERESITFRSVPKAVQIVM